MQKIDLDVQQRTTKGKKSKQLREQGWVPAVLYGPKLPSASLQVKEEALNKILKGGGSNVLINLKEGDKKPTTVLVREVQRNAITRKITHADFYALDLTKKIIVEVPLHYTGKPVGVTEGGILQPVVRTLRVECLPVAIPQSFEVDVTSLKIADSIHARELNLPEGVRSLIELDTTLVTVVPPIKEEEIAPPAPTAEEAAAAAAAPAGAAPAGAAPEEKAPEAGAPAKGKEEKKKPEKTEKKPEKE